MNYNLMWLMVLGIIIMKFIWIKDEIKLYKSRLNFTMFKTNFIEAIILLLQILQAIYLPLPKTKYDNLFIVMGFIMYLLGMYFAFSGKFMMNKVWGIPGIHSSKQTKLVTNGVFAISRNPIYVGIFLIFTGFSIAIRSYFIILRIPLYIYLYKSSIKEEKILKKKFGARYEKYMKKTSRFLFGF